MKVRDLVSAMEEIAPLSLAEGWDKVGLLAGDRERALTGPVLLTIDLTEAVLGEAIQAGAHAVVAYHPPIWEPLTRITDATPRQRIILRALEAGLAIYSPHTALDAVAGGVTDWLAEGLSGQHAARPHRRRLPRAHPARLHAPHAGSQDRDLRPRQRGRAGARRAGQRGCWAHRQLPVVLVFHQRHGHLPGRRGSLARGGFAGADRARGRGSARDGVRQGRAAHRAADAAPPAPLRRAGDRRVRTRAQPVQPRQRAFGFCSTSR